MVGKIILSLFFVSVARAESPDLNLAKEIILKGNKTGALACIACHQENGAGIPSAGFPQLAGLSSAYFSKQIYDFKNMLRINPVMQPIAKGLNESEIKSLAAYFSALAPVANTEKSTAPQLVEEGRLIAEKGLWEKGVPACFACHGPEGRGVGDNFPPIVSQGKTYLIQQFQAWKKGTRKNDPNQLMKTVAMKLTDKEINAVANFLGQVTMEVKK
ncbi:c-type cytochrome [Bdellovibrio svalbardensis]|uniref:Cytochrome c4 n=1 Tax=Bdellovibrio svalbardensis TaxID=2972972 RepID=A0ABT6DMQ3_9BACT|nr:c-type cytochrome [Bdellovibrio svalbardensis]MDG0818160.1 cytochrome c4 [Bdellovibrio svalbardensis]